MTESATTATATAEITDEGINWLMANRNETRTLGSLTEREHIVLELVEGKFLTFGPNNTLCYTSAGLSVVQEMLR